MEASQTEQGGTIPEGEGGPAEARVTGDQGVPAEQEPGATGIVTDKDGNTAFRQSAPPADAQSGVPPLPENAGVEPNPEVAGPVAASGQAPEGAEKEQPTQ